MNSKALELCMACSSSLVGRTSGAQSSHPLAPLILPAIVIHMLYLSAVCPGVFSKTTGTHSAWKSILWIVEELVSMGRVLKQLEKGASE